MSDSLGSSLLEPSVTMGLFDGSTTWGCVIPSHLERYSVLIGSSLGGLSSTFCFGSNDMLLRMNYQESWNAAEDNRLNLMINVQKTCSKIWALGNLALAIYGRQALAKGGRTSALYGQGVESK